MERGKEVRMDSEEGRVRGEGEKVNSIPSESWLDRVGERRTEVELICTCVGVPGFEGV